MDVSVKQRSSESNASSTEIPKASATGVNSVTL